MMPRAPIPESTSPSLEVERAVFYVQFCAILGVGGGGEGVGELLGINSVYSSLASCIRLSNSFSISFE